MSEEETGVKEENQAAADVVGEIEQDATAQETGETDTQAAAESKTVPLSALEAERQKRHQAEAQAMSLQQQFAVMQSQRQEVQEMPRQAQDYFAAQGLADDDIPTVAQLRAYAADIGQRQQRAQAYQSQVIENQQFIESVPDYAEKVGADNFMTGQFQPSQHLQDAMASRPALLKQYISGRMTPQQAYDAVELHLAKKELAAKKQSAREQDTQKKVALKTGPLSASAAGGGGGVKTASLVAGYDQGTREGRDKILETFQRIKEGDFDPD